MTTKQKISQSDRVEPLATDSKGDEQVIQTAAAPPQKTPKKEIGGPKGLEPTRYGDWEAKGRCYDF